MIHLLDIASFLFQAFLLRGHSDAARKLIAAQVSPGRRRGFGNRQDRVVKELRHFFGIGWRNDE